MREYWCRMSTVVIKWVVCVSTDDECVLCMSIVVECVVCMSTVVKWVV